MGRIQTSCRLFALLVALTSVPAAAGEANRPPGKKEPASEKEIRPEDVAKDAAARRLLAEVVARTYSLGKEEGVKRASCKGQATSVGRRAAKEAPASEAFEYAWDGTVRPPEGKVTSKLTKDPTALPASATFFDLFFSTFFFYRSIDEEFAGCKLAVIETEGKVTINVVFGTSANKITSITLNSDGVPGEMDQGNGMVKFAYVKVGDKFAVSHLNDKSREDLAVEYGKCGKWTVPVKVVFTVTSPPRPVQTSTMVLSDWRLSDQVAPAEKRPDRPDSRQKQPAGKDTKK